MDVDEAQVGRTISRLVAENGQLQAEVRRLQGILDGSEPAEGSWQAEALALRAALGRVQALHVAEPCSHCGPTGTCAHCDTAYPCPTVRALEGS